MAGDGNDERQESERRKFYAEWLDQHGVIGRPSLDQLMEMSEAYAAHRRRWQQARLHDRQRPSR
jgi:hypothetical protein